jgi:biopolymer transport protein ExbD
MSRFDPTQGYERPQIQLIPLIDIMFFALIFFMVLSVYFHIEAQMDIRVPESSQAKSTQSASTDIVININAAGNFIVNGTSMTPSALDGMLKKLSAVSGNQSVIIRADQKTFHKYVVSVLDICARNNITDVSFATSESQG